MLHPERVRDKMDEQRVTDQTDWRIEPYGWDSKDRTYYLLDDDRLYRMTDAPPPTATWKPKKNSKKAKAAARSAKRRRLSRSAATNTDDGDEEPEAEPEDDPEPEDDGLGGAKWECIAVTLPEVNAFLATIRKTRDENEKVLRDRIEEGLVPILEKQEESRKRKAQARERELLNLQKMATAKRSSRLAGKAEQQKQEQQSRDEEERRRKEEAASKKEDMKRQNLEKERDQRLMSRESRLKEREARRLQHQRELSQLSEDSKNLSSGTSRVSERRRQAEIDKNKQALEDLEQQEENWTFDCVCGMYGQVDDGTHSVACERCSVWQHSKCVGVSEKEADNDDFHFICSTCKRQEASPKQPVIKLKLKSPGEAPSSPSRTAPADTESPPASHQPPTGSGLEAPSAKPLAKPDLPPAKGAASHGAAVPNGLPLQHGSRPRISGQPAIPIKLSTQTHIPPPVSLSSFNSDGPNPFSSPHPTLSPPQQSPNKSRAYSTINKSSPSSAATRTGEHQSLPPKGVFHVSPKPNGAARNPASPATSLPPHADVAVPPVAARSDSPLKQPLEAASSSLPVLSPPSVSFSTSGRPPSSNAGLSTPQLKASHGGGSSPLMATPTLPPTQNGLSPSKRSSPPVGSSGGRSTPAPAILPPVTTLSPSPQQQINTPPVKSTEPVRPVSQQSSETTRSL